MNGVKKNEERRRFVVRHLTYGEISAAFPFKENKIAYVILVFFQWDFIASFLTYISMQFVFAFIYQYSPRCAVTVLNFSVNLLWYFLSCPLAFRVAVKIDVIELFSTFVQSVEIHDAFCL